MADFLKEACVRLSLVMMMTVLAGCASQSGPERTADRHAANVAAAQEAGYKVVTHGERTIFCPTASPTGSHMAPTCISESQFEQMIGGPRSMSSAAHFTNTPPGPGPNAGH
jgi:hypothetical protein